MKRAVLIGVAIVAVGLLVAGVAFGAPAVDVGHDGFATVSYSPLLKPIVARAPRIAVADTAAYTEAVAISDEKRAVSRAAAKRATATQSTGTDVARARSVLAGLVAKYPILRGTTVEMGDARGYQAVAYYRSGRIVVSRTHRASIERILNHEVWHIIDYRDNGRIDWGESVPK